MAKKSADRRGQRAGAKGSKAAAASAEIRVAEHPRARRQIALAKSYAALAAFGLVAWSSWRGGAPFLDVAERALIWGVAAYVVVWALAVQVWRHVAVAEVRAAERRWREQRAEEEERVRKLTQVLEENAMPTRGTGGAVPGA